MSGKRKGEKEKKKKKKKKPSRDMGDEEDQGGEVEDNRSMTVEREVFETFLLRKKEHEMDMLIKQETLKLLVTKNQIAVEKLRLLKNKTKCDENDSDSRKLAHFFVTSFLYLLKRKYCKQFILNKFPPSPPGSL